MPNQRKKLFTVLTVSFIASFILLVGAALYALRQINANNAFSAQVDHTNAVISELYKLDIIVRDLDVKERGYMITGDSSHLKELFAVQKKIQYSTHSLRTLLRDSKRQMELLTLLRGTLVLRISAIKKNLQYYPQQERKDIPRYFYDGRVLRKQATDYINQMHKNERQLLLNRYEQKKNSERIAQSVVQTLLISFFVLTLFLFVVLVREIYMRKNFQEELQKRVRDLKQTNEELEQIAFVLSHDIQEPLRKIRIFSNKLLYSKDDKEKTAEAAGRLDRSAGVAQSLLEDMQVLLGLRNDQYEEYVPLNNILETVRQDLQDTIQQKNADIHSDALPVIRGNYKQLQLLFKNILDNALKFAKEDTPPIIRIRHKIITDDDTHSLTTNEGHEYHQLTIEDNGIGFEQVYADRIFKIFQRLHSDEQYSGKGIGLSLCQRIMTNHRGAIKAFGNMGKGAIFTLYFPKS